MLLSDSLRGLARPRPLGNPPPGVFHDCCEESFQKTTRGCCTSKLNLGIFLVSVANSVTVYLSWLQPLIKPTEKFTLEEDAVLRLGDPVVLIGKDQHP